MDLDVLPTPAPPQTREGGAPWPVTHDLAYVRTAIVNVFFYGEAGAGDGAWVLVDTGMYGYADTIVRAAEARFGEGARPSCIVMTHGHFDHRGTVRELAALWDVPVYAHELELPYLTGRSSYPPPDPTVGGGAMAALSWTYPRGPIDLGGRVRALPADGTVPGMPGWRWIHTPGHTAGHVALFRDSDRTLVAGDAFVTTKQESAFSALTQRKEINGPPMYFTPDWDSARASVRTLAELEPEVGATGHGVPVRGEELRRGLHALAEHFDEWAVPSRGRYVGRPAVADRGGVVSVPPRTPEETRTVALTVGGAVLAGAVLARLLRRTD